jgi:hypothetical protein
MPTIQLARNADISDDATDAPSFVIGGLNFT